MTLDVAAILEQAEPYLYDYEKRKSIVGEALKDAGVACQADCLALIDAMSPQEKASFADVMSKVRHFPVVHEDGSETMHLVMMGGAIHFPPRRADVPA